MKNKDLEIEKIWDESRNSQDVTNRFNSKDLKDWLSKKPQQLYIKLFFGIRIYLYLKYLFFFSQIGLIYIYVDEARALIISSFLLLLTILLIIKDLSLISKLKILNNVELDLSRNLNNFLLFFNKDYHSYIIYGSLINPILIMTGGLYYDYFVHGHAEFINILSSQIVFGIIMIIAYLIAFWGLSKSSLQHINEIQTYLEQLHDENILFERLYKIRKIKRRNTLLSVILLIFGLLLFILIWFLK